MLVRLLVGPLSDDFLLAPHLADQLIDAVGDFAVAAATTACIKPVGNFRERTLHFKQRAIELTVNLFGAGALGMLALAHVWQPKSCRNKKVPKAVKLTYFNFRGPAEKYALP